MNDTTYAEAVALSKHYIALDWTTVHLSGDDDPTINWSACVGLEHGGLRRLDIDTSIRFIFKEAGLLLSWDFDIEKREANGHGYYQIKTGEIRRLLAPVRNQFVQYLAESADKVEAKADEYQRHAERQYGEAATLRRATHVEAKNAHPTPT